MTVILQRNFIHVDLFFKIHFEKKNLKCAPMMLIHSMVFVQYSGGMSYTS